MTSHPDNTPAQAEAGRLLARLFTSAGSADPYPVYRQIRDHAPVLRLGDGTIVLTRYDDVHTALRHADLGKPEAGFGASRGEVPGYQVRQAMARWRSTILFSNPPEHTRLRRLISNVFTPRHVEQMAGAVGATADRYLSRLDGQPGADFVSAVALPLPARVVADLLGIPGTDWQALAPDVRDLVNLFEPQPTADVVARAIAAQDKVGSYLSSIIAAKRRRPADDLLSRLAASRDEDALDDTEMVATATLLFAAGFETASNLLANGLHALLTHPVQLAALRQQPGLAARAVEEMLRYDSPVQLTSRAALRPCSVAGAGLAAGQTVLVLIGAANRDPHRFSDPDKLDIARDEGPSLSFATGIHFCLGAHLARLEAAQTFTRLLRRFGRLELASPPHRRDGRSLRGFAELRVTARM